MLNPKFLFFVYAITSTLSTFSQSFLANYKDGCLYVKLQKGMQAQYSSLNPTRIPVTAFSNPLRDYLKSLGVTRIYRPFYQANDEPELSMILRVEFKSFNRIQEAIDRLNSMPGITYAEKIPIMQTDAVPNDPLWATATGSTHLNQIGAQNAWNVFNGNSNITIAIVDNAVMWTHVDLVQNTYTNTAEASGTPGVDDDANGYIDDINGWSTGDNNNNAVPTNSLMDHGTHCAGIAGARTDNTVGVASIGWNVKIIPIQAEPDNGSTTAVSYGYEGIVYAVKAKARIISCSWGGSGASFTEQSVINYAWNRGCIVMAAAGNANTSTPSYPGAYTNVYCVASISPTDIKSTFSNFGTWVDIAAPGNNLLSTVPYTGTPVYVQKSGTSMATPLVAGLAGLMLSKSPNMTRQDVLNCISNSAVNIYTLAANAAYTAGNQLGAGRIDAYAAMLCAANYTAQVPIANFNALPRFTCPNTLVQFADSSLYAPTSFAWIFSGGNPATSTLANPAVSYTANGNYNVSLTVANASGTHSITKTNYIQITGPQNLPFAEGFQNTAFPPLNWYANNIFNDPIYFQRKTGVGAFGTSTACAMFDNYNLYAPGERDELRSPRFDFSTVNTAKLRFDVAFAQYNSTFSDTLEVKLSTNCGATWTSIYLKGGSQLATAPNQTASQFTPTVNQWRTDSVNISNWVAGQGNVMFSFINRGHYGQAYYLDNINLFFPTPTASINLPASACAFNTVACLANGSVVGQYSWTCAGATPPVATGTLYSPSFSAPGIYTVQMLALNGTGSVNLNQTLSIAASPTLSVSGATICAGQTASVSVNGATSYTWSNGSNASGFTLSPVNSTVLSVTGSNGGACSANATVQVLVNSQPTLSVSNVTTCPGGTVILNASGAATYSWNTGATTSSISVSPSVSTVYTIVGNNGSCSDTKTLSVTIGPALSVSISAISSSICSGQSIILNASGANSYTWSNAQTSNSITVAPNTNTNYSVIGSSGTCTGTAIFSISVNPTPTITISNTPNTTLCSGQTATLSGLGATTYTWSNGATGSVIAVTPSVNTSYTLTGESAGCTSNTTLQVLVSPQPTLSLSNVTTCPNSTVTLNASGATSYTWSNGASGASISVSPTISTIYTVTGANGTCTDTQTLSVTLAPALPVNISALSNSICSGQTLTLNASGANSYTWSNASNLNAIIVTPTSSTSYSVLGSSGTCTGSAVFTLVVNPNPTLTLFPANSISVCANQNSSVSVSGANTYTWSNTVTGSILVQSFNTSTIISVTGESLGCTDTKSINITVLPTPSLNLIGLLPTNPTQSVSPLICNGDSVLLSNNGILVPGANSFTWSTGSNNATVIIKPTATTVYSVQISNGICSQISSYTLTVFNGSPFSLSNQTVCAGNSVTLNPNPPGSYTFISTGNATVHVGNTYTFTATNPQQYTVSTGLANCAYSQTVSIGLMNIAVNASSVQVCSGQTIQLQASGAPNYTWSNGMQTPIIIISPTASAIYSVIGSSGTCSLTGAISVTVLPKPISTITTTNTACGSVCNGQMQALTMGGTGPYSYSLSGTSCTSVPCTNLCAGLYLLKVSDSTGCSTSYYFSIASAPNAIQANLSYTHASCANCSNGVLKANPNGGTAPYTYTWMPGNFNQSTYSNLKPGCYTVTVTDAGGCSVITNQCIGIATELEELSYNRNETHVFPNPGSGLLHIESYDYNTLQIYNNLGQCVYFTLLQNGLQSLQINLPEGVYSLVLLNTNGNLNSKTIKYIHKSNL